MSVCRKLPDGTIQKIAGHTILLDANASEVREGRWNLVSSAVEWVQQNITFTDPMPDTDYIVIIESDTQTWQAQPGPYRITNKTTTGFTLASYNSSDSSHQVSMNISGTYTAYKPVKIEGYTALQNKVNNPDDTPTIDSMNLVTSDGVARAIENASAVWKGTKAEWNALPAADKVKYDLAVLLDQTLVKAIDRTDGTETNVADLSGQFVGTHAEWEAESDKTQYKTALLTDERTTVNEVTSTGALNEVADNAKIWRGTKAEWEAMSAAEKDKWDQAEIETIEAQGLNPFRTLSDPETLSIATNTDYTCPHDGILSFTSGTNSGVLVYVNNVLWGTDDYGAGSAKVGHVSCPVQQGDIVKYAGTATVKARWYTTDINPGNPIDYPVVHRSQSLDWENKVAITWAEALAGWTAPADGYFFGAGMGSPNWTNATINNVPMAYYIHSGTYDASFCVQVPVEKGDVIKFNGSIDSGNCTFVPYKDYPDYSTTEHWTGRRWIDGKKIYSKVFTGTATNNTYIPHEITGLGTIINMHGSVYNSSNCFPISSYDQGYMTRPSVEGHNIRFVVAGFDSVNYNLIIEYTKTTND